MARYRSGVALAAAAAGLLISIILIGRWPRLREQGRARLQAAAADLDLKQRELASAVEARAKTIAQLPRLGWAISTDAATTRDLTTDELGFRLQTGEIIEVAQIQKQTSRVATLLSLPTGTLLRAPMTEIGPHLWVSGDRMLVAVVVAIEPRERIDVVAGSLVVARRLDVKGTTDQLIRAGIAARLVTSNGSITLTESPGLTQQPEVTVPVGAMSPLRLVARLPSPWFGTWMRILLGMAALLFWGTAAVLSVRPPGITVAGPATVGESPAWLVSSPPANLPLGTDPELDLLITQPNIDGAVASLAEAEVISGPIEDTAHAIHGAVPYSQSIFDEFMDRTRY